jgi:NAD(P)-dependent dehydrogenase (short-subunit alcohol dehydrogenase family)
MLSVAPQASVEPWSEASPRSGTAVRTRLRWCGCDAEDLTEQGAYNEYLDAAKRKVVLRRLGKAVNIAPAVASLPPGACRIMGQNLNVDGGLSL